MFAVMDQWHEPQMKVKFGFPRALEARGKPQPAPTAQSQKNQESRFNPGRSEPKHQGGGC